MTGRDDWTAGLNDWGVAVDAVLTLSVPAESSGDERSGDEQSGDELRSLLRWLRDDEDLRAARISARSAQPAPGEMGHGLDLVQVLLEPDGLASALATAVVTAVVTWLSTRRRKVKVRLRHGDREIEVEAAGPGNIEGTVKSVLDHLRTGEGS
jgi:Effector Associated Constant Component 1